MSFVFILFLLSEAGVEELCRGMAHPVNPQNQHREQRQIVKSPAPSEFPARCPLQMCIRDRDQGESLFFSNYDPATVEMLTNMGKTRIV